MPETVARNVLVAQVCREHVAQRQQSFCRQMCCLCVSGTAHDTSADEPRCDMYVPFRNNVAATALPQVQFLRQ